MSSTVLEALPVLAACRSLGSCMPTPRARSLPPPLICFDPSSLLPLLLPSFFFSVVPSLLLSLCLSFALLASVSLQICEGGNSLRTGGKRK